MLIVPLKKWHLDVIQLQGAQDYVGEWMTTDVKLQLADSMAFAALDGDEVLGCAGVVPMWEGRGAAWAMFTNNIGTRFIGMHRAVKSFLEVSPVRRIEAAVDVDFKPGHRWMQQLGFRMETERMKSYFPNARDASMYVRGV